MTFPTIPTVAAGRVLTSLGTTCASGQTFPNLSSLTKNAGDLLIAIVGIYDGNSANAEFSSWGGGFTEFGDFSTTTTSAIGCAYKWSDGTETGTFGVTSADTSTNDYWTILLSIPGAHPTTPPEAGGYATFTGANVDPGALNPAGWGTEDTLWIAVGSCNETSLSGSFTGVSAAPASYSGYVGTGMSADAIGAVSGAVAFRQLNAASEDPGAFTCDTSNAREAGITIAVRPAPVTHATTGTLAGPGSTIVGSVSSATTRPSSGVLVGPGAALSGAAARFRAYATSGVLSGPGAALSGSAERSEPGGVTHTTSGDLTGAGASVAGTSSSATSRPSSGALTGPGAAVAGTASRFRAMLASGDLAGPGAIVVGTAARFRAMDASGALAGPGAAVSGSAERSGPGVVAHATSGDLAGAGAVVAGASSSATDRPSSGALAGPGAIIVGTAARFRAMDAGGALAGPGALVTGTAAHSVLHPTTGTLTGPGAAVSGSADRQGLFITHACSGALIAAGSALSGDGIHGEIFARLLSAQARVAGVAASRLLTAESARRTTLHEATS